MPFPGPQSFWQDHPGGWTGTASRASCIPTALPTSTAKKRWEENIPDSPVLPNPSPAPASPVPGVAEEMCDTKTSTQVVQAASVHGFPKFWLQECNPSWCPLNMEIQERENGGRILSWEFSLTGTSFLYRKLMFTTAIHLFWNSVHLL